MYQMKLTQTLSVAAFAAALCCTAQASPRHLSQQKVNATPLETGAASRATELVPTNTEIISETPEGTLYYPAYGSATTWTYYNGNVASFANDGFAGAMVVADDAIYLRDFITENPTGTWIKGDLADDGTVTFRFPQLIYRTEATEARPSYPYLVAAMKPKAEWNGSISLVVDPDDCDMVMHWDGQHLVQDVPDVAIGLEDYAGIVGLVSNTGGFSGLAEQGTVYSLDYEEAPQVPDFVETSDYVAIYTNEYGMDGHIYVKLGEADGQLWIQGLNLYAPEAWICGDIEGTTATFRPQYGGVYEGFMMYLTGATGTLDKITLKEGFTMQRTDIGWSSINDVIIANIGWRVLGQMQQMEGIFIEPLSEGTRIPAKPDNLDGMAYDEALGGGVAQYRIPTVDTEGKDLDTYSLYYNIYFDGVKKTFYPNDYFVLTPMTDVPWNYANSEQFFRADDNTIMLGLFEPVKEVKIQSVYLDRNKLTYSEPAYINFGASVEGVGGAATVVAEEWYNLSGIRVERPTAAGLYIKRSTMSDGSVKTTKSVVR